MEKSLNDRIYKVFLLLILFCGIFLRTKYFFQFRWLWGDELALYYNIRSDASIFNVFSSLDNNQVAPPLFLFFSKLILEFLKFSNESYLASLRIIPFIASIISIFAFFDLTRKFLLNKLNILTSNLLFCLNMHLIYFASDFKQYSSDVCVFILILISYFYIDFDKFTIKKLCLIGIIYAFSMFFSFTSLFAIGAIFVLILNQNFKKENISKFIALILPCIIGFVLLYSTQKNILSNDYLYSFWANGFVNNIHGLVYYLFSNAFSYFLSIPVNKIDNLIPLLLILGIIKLLLNNEPRPKIIILLFPIMSLSLSVMLHIYPFYERLALFMFPLLILLIINLFEINKWYINVFSLTLFTTVLFVSLKYQNPFNAKIADLKQPLLYSFSVCGENDTLLLNRYDFDIYAKYNNIYHFNRKFKCINFTKENFENLEAGQYCLVNAVTDNHPDLTDNNQRKIYHAKLLRNLKDTEIIETYNDGKENILVKFRKQFMFTKGK